MSETVAIPVWLLTLILTGAGSGVIAAIGFTTSYAKMKVLLAHLERTADALHDRVDSLEKLTAKYENIDERLDEFGRLLHKLDKDVAIIKRLDDEERVERTGRHRIVAQDSEAPRTKLK